MAEDVDEGEAEGDMFRSSLPDGFTRVHLPNLWNLGSESGQPSLPLRPSALDSHAVSVVFSIVTGLLRSTYKGDTKFYAMSAYHCA